MNDPLAQYRKKRNLGRSPEPEGKRRGKRKGRRRAKPPVFVIQKHDASSLHYDFRLEAGGVLKSWAVPKGPSTDPREKRLAVQVEDHPLEYGDFEGVIPEGEYGAGTVLIWDAGTYENIKEPDEDGADPPSIEEQIEQGHVTIWLNGKKLRGGYALTRAKLGGEEHNWLLVKIDDDEADARRNPTSTQPDSVRSGRSIDEVREQEAPSEES